MDKKYWFLLLPYFAYALTVFDFMINYWSGGGFTFFSYPFLAIIFLIYLIFGDPGLAIFTILLALYIVYSLFIYAYAIKEKQLNSVIAIIILLPIFISSVNSTLSFQAYQKENRRILAEHDNLQIEVFEPTVNANQIRVPVRIQGLIPQNEYRIDSLLRDEDSGNLGSVSMTATYFGGWVYSSKDVRKQGDKIILVYNIDQERYDSSQLELLVDIRLDFNLFYSEWYDVPVS